jgi:hypothetical protein
MHPSLILGPLRPKQFTKHSSPVTATTVIDSHLREVVEGYEPEFQFDIDFSFTINSPCFVFLSSLLWKAIYQSIDVSSCDIYSFEPDEDDSPDNPFSEPELLWSLYFFFYHRAEQKLLYFSVQCVNRTSELYDLSEAESEEEDERDIEFSLDTTDTSSLRRRSSHHTPRPSFRHPYPEDESDTPSSDYDDIESRRLLHDIETHRQNKRAEQSKAVSPPPALLFRPTAVHPQMDCLF